MKITKNKYNCNELLERMNKKDIHIMRKKRRRREKKLKVRIKNVLFNKKY